MFAPYVAGKGPCMSGSRTRPATNPNEIVGCLVQIVQLNRVLARPMPRLRYHASNISICSRPDLAVT